MKDLTKQIEKRIMKVMNLILALGILLFIASLVIGIFYREILSETAGGLGIIFALVFGWYLGLIDAQVNVIKKGET